MGFSKNRNTSEISYMINVSYKAANRSNTLCIARFDNAGNDICHRKFAVREVFRGSHNKIKGGIAIVGQKRIIACFAF